MCFSFEVSLLTFVTSWSISLYLLNKGLTKERKQDVIFLMIFSLMQLPDAIFWYTNMKRDKINYWTTSFFIPLILSMQILYNVYVRRKNKNNLINIAVVLFIIYMFIRFNGYSKSLCCNKFTSPIWGSKELKLWELLIFLLLIMYPRWNVILTVLFVIIPLIHLIAGGAYGSLWCAVSNILAFYYLYKY